MNKAAQFKKVLIGAVLVTAAAFLALLLKDWMDRGNPNFAVPQLSVTADGQEVPVVIGGYFWSFPFGEVAEKAEIQLEEIGEDGIPAHMLRGGENLQLTFSREALVVHIDRSEPHSLVFFSPVDHDLTVPFEPGSYIYKVAASFEEGRVQYFFRVESGV